MKIGPKVVFHLGDSVQNGYNQRDWKKFNEITKELRASAEFFPVMGNHEFESPFYFKNFGLTKQQCWYAVKRSGIHFVILDSNLSLRPWSRQYRWLEDKLKDLSRDRSPIVVLIHRPLLNVGRHGKEAKALREQITPILEKYGVIMVFSGHEHSYQRFFRKGIYYVDAGGGGGGLYGAGKYVDAESRSYNQKFLMVHNFCTVSFADGVITVRAYDADLNIIDEFSLNTLSPLKIDNKR
jgi:predicted MPP superfamily phosphohydrolase